MKKLILLSALGSCGLCMTTAAQSPFDGTWKIDMNKVDYSKTPDVFVLQDGMYECKSCSPPYKVKADGTDQPVTGHPYFDSVAVKLVSDNEMDGTHKKDGKVVSNITSTLSPDGNTLTFTFSDSSASNGGAPVTGKGEQVRVAKGPAGSHGVSGSWRMNKMESLSDNATVWTYKVSGDEITMTTPTGQSYTAKFNGPEVPMKGDPGVTSVLVKMLGKDSLQETDKRDGKVIYTGKFTVGADGKTAKVVAVDTLQNVTTEFAAVKQ